MIEKIREIEWLPFLFLETAVSWDGINTWPAVCSCWKMVLNKDLHAGCKEGLRIVSELRLWHLKSEDSVNLLLKAFLRVTNRRCTLALFSHTIPQFHHRNFSFFHSGKTSAFVINFWYKLYHLKYALRN